MAIISNGGLGMKAAATTVSAAFLSRTKNMRKASGNRFPRSEALQRVKKPAHD